MPFLNMLVASKYPFFLSAVVYQYMNQMTKD